MRRHMILVLLLISSAVVIPFISVFAQQKPVPEAQEIIIRVDGASCPFCAFGLEKRLGQLAGVASVRLEMKDGEVFVTLKKGARVSERALRQAVEEAGFTPREIIFPPEP